MFRPPNNRSSLSIVLACLCLLCPAPRATAAPETTVLRHLGGRWYVLEGDWTGADLDALGIPSLIVRKEATAAPRGRGEDDGGAEGGLLLYRDAGGFVDPFSENYGDTNGDLIQDLRVTYGAAEITIQSQDLPNHPTGTFPNSANPNSIQVKNFTFHLTTTPQPAALPTSAPLGPIGVALNGVVFYNPYSMGGVVAIAGAGEEWFDSCCGHPDQSGTYHYHKYPRCVKSPFTDRADAHSPLVGFAWDGYAVYGPYEAAGVLAQDLGGAAALDALNGHTDAERGYHYHVSPGRFPYLIGGYRGTPDTRNNMNLMVGDNDIDTGVVPMGNSPYDDVLTSVAPSQVDAGETLTVTLGLTTAGAQPPVPMSVPLVVNVGPYVGTNIARNGTTITATIAVPADASTNLFDAHLEFAAPMGAPNQNRVVYRRSDSVLVLSQAAASVPTNWVVR